MKKLTILFIITGMLATMTSCKKDFLQEEGYGATTSIFETQEGLITLVNGQYNRLRLTKMYGVAMLGLPH